MAEQKYIPGVCNIGPAERTRRRQTGLIGLVVTVLLLAALVSLQAPAALRLFLFLPAFMAATGFLQDAFHFCAGFGLRGLYNVVHMAGVTNDVTTDEFRRKDRAKAFQIFGISVGIAAVVTIASLWL